ncbi:hypothetical protein KCU73_g36, partial [Aureobasidium melanogenum]
MIRMIHWYCSFEQLRRGCTEIDWNRVLSCLVPRVALGCYALVLYCALKVAVAALHAEDIGSSAISVQLCRSHRFLRPLPRLFWPQIQSSSRSSSNARSKMRRSSQPIT